MNPIAPNRIQLPGAAIQEKVFKELTADSGEACHHAVLPRGVSQRVFGKLSLHEAVRYKPQDPVESWLDSLLFLDVPGPPTDPKAYGTVKACRFLEIDTSSNSQLLSEARGKHIELETTSLYVVAKVLKVRFFFPFLAAKLKKSGHGPFARTLSHVAQ